ncbi:FAD:protein FMN transferase [Sphingomonas sp. BT553]|uniref:FAD:protein FMN transferase n=2 Tax=Sphingomonas mollis TaxID=2795726 RepID=A0ABS0XNZ5_9SPHN|nr:FAD:protein FMN transferase [Sphingomonas sp. BT553]
MGTTWRVLFAAPQDCDVDGVRHAIVRRLAGLVAEMSHWVPDSLLSRFNRSSAGTWTTLPPDFAQVMHQGLAIAATTRGAFDPALGRLVDCWGFGSIAVARPPDATTIEAAHASSGWQRLTYDPTGRHLHQSGGVSLDLSGIAKGHAVDAVADLLRTFDIMHALVEIGGELVGRGIRPDGDPWWVDLEVPPGISIQPLRLALHGMAVATSGNYRRGAHTINPRTGRPITSGVVSASVIHTTALAADAWATALTVAGPVDGLTMARDADIAARLVTVADGSVQEHFTPALISMLEG